ncbi:MAG: hypothetical protein HY882_14540 [Deltaproteobacteria bacterium]|nr:hypothetical protein [Deltaproteobacteria bacterium]
MSLELMNPCGVFRYDEEPIAPRLRDLTKKVLGLLDNSKNNADLFLDHVLEVLNKAYSFADVLRIKKSSGAVPAPFTTEFLERCNVVINAFGD